MKENTLVKSTICTTTLEMEKLAKQKAMNYFLEHNRGIMKMMNRQDTITTDEDGNRLVTSHKKYISHDRMKFAMSAKASCLKVSDAYYDLYCYLKENGLFGKLSALTELYNKFYDEISDIMGQSIHDATQKKNMRNIRQNNIDRNSCL